MSDNIVRVDDLDKVWILVDTSTQLCQTAIAINSDGILLTSALNLNKKAVFHARNYSCNWKKVSYIDMRESFNLAAFRVGSDVKGGVKMESVKEKMESEKKRRKLETGFPWFDLRVGPLELNRGDKLTVIFHQGRMPFSVKFGRCCREFRETTDFVDTLPSFDCPITVDSQSEEQEVDRLVALARPGCMLKVGMVVDEVEGHPDGDISDDSGSNEFEPLDTTGLRCLHPDVPLLQLHRVGRGNGSRGGVALLKDGQVAGIYSFAKHGFQFFIPRPVLLHFCTMVLRLPPPPV